MTSTTDVPATRLLLKPSEAAKALAVSPRTLFSLTQPRGPIPAVRFGSCLRYDVNDLRAEIERRKGNQR